MRAGQGSLRSKYVIKVIQMFQVALGPFSLLVHRGPLPGIYSSYREHALLSEEFDLDKIDGEACMIAVCRNGDRPFLVVAQRFEPCVAGFDPGALIVPETGLLFIGAGTRTLAYSLSPLKRLWEDTADVGFWSWRQHGQCVLMSAECELAAWDTSGKKLWTTFVEPPWSYRVESAKILLDTDAGKYDFHLRDGPPIKR